MDVQDLDIEELRDIVRRIDSDRMWSVVNESYGSASETIDDLLYFLKTGEDPHEDMWEVEDLDE